LVFILIFFIIALNLFINLIGDWGLGIGDWGLGIGANTPNPIPQTPNPKPQNPNKKKFLKK